MNLRDKTYLSIVNTLCDLTDDTKKGVAAIIVKDDNIISHGVNELPKGCLKLKERCEAPLKYNWILHAERNAILKAAKEGIKIDGCSMYVTYFPCSDCARAIIQSGISKVYSPKPDLTHHKWGNSWREAILMFTECNIEIIWID